MTHALVGVGMSCGNFSGSLTPESQIKVKDQYWKHKCHSVSRIN